MAQFKVCWAAARNARQSERDHRLPDFLRGAPRAPGARVRAAYELRTTWENRTGASSHRTGVLSQGSGGPLIPGYGIVETHCKVRRARFFRRLHGCGPRTRVRKGHWRRAGRSLSGDWGGGERWALARAVSMAAQLAGLGAGHCAGASMRGASPPCCFARPAVRFGVTQASRIQRCFPQTANPFPCPRKGRCQLWCWLLRTCRCSILLWPSLCSSIWA